ncbi:MAG TPA: hypothetical protein VL588_02785 [Bdellovibrionota bacterium]|jgi:hypothetical protein|nr:hypothetical protein [Bdellovibrionota bacterium]
MKHLIATLALALTSTSAFAVYQPGWERPVMKSDMRVISAEYGYENVEGVTLTLTRRDGANGYTGLIMETTEQADSTRVTTQHTVTLEVKGVSMDECGTTTIRAALPGQNPMGARTTVTLIDHSTSKCRDHSEHAWEAHVRTGFGWCGTGDATMDLEGDVEPVFTIMSRERGVE